MPTNTSVGARIHIVMPKQIREDLKEAFPWGMLNRIVRGVLYNYLYEMTPEQRKHFTAAAMTGASKADSLWQDL